MEKINEIRGAFAKWLKSLSWAGIYTSEGEEESLILFALHLFAGAPLSSFNKTIDKFYRINNIKTVASFSLADPLNDWRRGSEKGRATSKNNYQ